MKDFEEHYVPHLFENICKQYLIRKNKEGEIEPVIEKIGKYYYDNPEERSNGEFDIVTEDELGYAFYEVKFKKKQISDEMIDSVGVLLADDNPDEMIDEEIEQVKATGLDCYKYVFFSRSGFRCEKRENVKLIDIEELFAE